MVVVFAAAVALAMVGAAVRATPGRLLHKARKRESAASISHHHHLIF